MTDDEKKKAIRKTKKYVHKLVKIVKRWDREAKRLADIVKKRRNNGS
jgi:hypothetical protein